MRGQVSYDGREEADDDDADDEARPAIPVVSGRNAGEQNLPEHRQEVHDVVEAGRKPFFACVVLVLISLVQVWGAWRHEREKRERQRQRKRERERDRVREVRNGVRE